MKKEEWNHFKIESDGSHPVFRQRLSLGQKAADFLTKHMGSWKFIIFFLFFLLVWVGINAYFLIIVLKGKPFDPFPFILLNLILSCLAAIQAPIILMSQNRQTEKDRIMAKYDYDINRKAEREIRKVQEDLNEIKRILNKNK